MNLCVHSSLGIVFHWFSHYAICSTGFPSPVYLCAMSPSLVLNLVWISILHRLQSSIVHLCVSHHITWVDFNTTSNAASLYFYGTRASKNSTNVVISNNISYLDGLKNSIPIQRNDLIMHTHRRVETLCILCC
jgi:hypothetical protein